MKVVKLIKELEKQVKDNGENIDVQTFSGELGIYNKDDEIDRIKILDLP